jgi:transposase InsO family protein
LYADDSKIFGGSTARMHIKCISLCLNRLHKKGFRLSLKKCLFFVKTMEHLGFTAVIGGTKPTQHNIRKLLAISIKKVKDIRGFIGLSNYYRRYVRGYSEIVAPLLPYLRKDARLPTVLPDDITTAVNEIKRILSAFPILRNPDFKRQFLLETDGSKHGFGAALKQIYEGVEMVCAYASSHILKCQLKYSSDMLELVAAVWGMKHFHHYLRRPFILKTDNIILKWLRKKTVDATKPSFIRWILEAQEYEFEVQHVPGKQLVAGDLMSRAGARDSEVDPIMMELESSKYFKAALKIERALERKVKQDLAPVTLDRDVWIREQANDPRLIRVAANKLNQERCFELVDGLWHHKQVYHRRGSVAVAKLRVVVPASLRPTLMAIVHGLLGHRGVKPIVRYLTRLLYWPGIWVYVRAWVGSCSDCKRRKMSRVKQPWLGDVKHMTTPWYFVAIDYILGELPESAEGYRYCLTVMCVFTRYPFAIPLRTKEPDELATALFTFVFSIFGFPVIVHSDHDTTLINQALELAFKRFNVKRSYTLWSHPESNGHLERFHRLVNETMAIILPRYTDWPEMLPVVMFTYRNLVNETTGYTPHYMNFGRNALMPLEMTWCIGVLEDVLSPSELATASRGYVDRLISRLQGAFHFVRRAQWLASRRNKDRLAPKAPEAGKRKRNIEAICFKTGDMVYLREEASVHNKVGKMRDLVPNPDEFVPLKWRFKWTGPHLVMKRDGDRAYVIYHSERHEELLVHIDDLRMHDAFSDEIFDTAQGTAYVTPRDLPPPLGYNTEFPKDAKSLQPAVGDMCLAHVPLFKPEDFVIVKALGDGDFQWYSSTFAGGRLDNNWDSFEVLERTTWLPGWLLEPEFQRVQYVYLQPAGSRPWTCTVEELPYGFMLWDFDLTASSKVRKAMVDWVRQYVRPSNSTKVRHGM